MEWSSISFYLYQDPLRWNGHWFSCAFILMPSTKAMVIDLSYQGPLQRQWSLIFHIEALCKAMVINFSYQDPLRWNGHWFSYAFLSRPSTKAMVNDLSNQGPVQRQWSLIFHIEALCKSNGHRSFISRPSAKQWSSIFHIKTFFDGMVIDFHVFSDRGPLQKQWSSIFQIKALYKGNGHWCFISKPSSKQWSSIFHIEALCKSNGHRSVILRPSAKAMVINLSYRGPLQSNGHRSFISRPSLMEWSLISIRSHIEALCKSNGHRSFISRPSPMEWSLIFLNVCIDVVFLEPVRN